MALLLRLWLSLAVWLLFNSLYFNAHVSANSFNTSSVQLSCHGDERSALLQFKQSLVIDRSASVYEGAYPKVSSWKPKGEGSDCCSWDGVECDEKTGHVIGLILSSSCLYGSINSNSSLFHLVHLQKLNLADNHFNYSLIPSAIGQLMGLTYLNLSESYFYGQVPFEISHLSKLISLDLSTPFHTDEPKTYHFLGLKNPSLSSLIQNLTSLELLSLTSVYIPSTVPDFLSNFSSLKTVILQDCGLYGEFPAKIFHLPNLKVLKLGRNTNLTGHLPEFHQESPLERLILSLTGFSGSIPCTIQKLTQLRYLNLGENRLSGSIPPCLGNLTKLVGLALPDNNLIGNIPSSFGKLTQLETLNLEENNLNGLIPFSFQNLSQLSYLNLRDNSITGPIPTWIGNLTKLSGLFLFGNKLYGSIPSSLFNLMNLQFLFLHSNDLNGVLEFDLFFNMMSLVYLELSRNKLSFVFKQRSINSTTSQLVALGLSSCSLSQFPNLLRYQNKLKFLDLSGNRIQGQIPAWMLNASVETLEYLDLSGNLLVDFHQPSLTFLPWINLLELDLSDNMLQSQLPIPPKSITHYLVSNNSLTGEISSAICNCNSLRLLDFSSNNFSGMLPQCLGNFNSLTVLNLRNNSFHGAIPQVCTQKTNLRMIDLSHNKFQGQLPESLEACVMLEYLDLTNNQLIGEFPTWLGTLSELKLLSPRRNGFFGVIRKPKQDFEFPKLHVIDISVNNFTGNLPFEYILIWNAMTVFNATDTGYMNVQSEFRFVEGNPMTFFSYYPYSTTIVDKGVERYYEVIRKNFAYIDFSCNKFNGKIPQVIAKLKALCSLNLSFNSLTGGIPSSLGNLTELESLDLSNNKLSGEIPQQLTGLTFLQSFDVSHNNLTGPIPQGNQFRTFENTSFESNPGLCGIPLSTKCENLEALPLQPSVVEEDDEESESPIELDWKFVLAGCISGFLVGVALGDMLITKRQRWFLKVFRRIPPRIEIKQLIN